MGVKYRAEIDGLRTLAVLPVIFFHAGFEWFSGGFVGVDVFFVISGYLITTVIMSELLEERFSIVDFYERRARRILPALFFVMAACLPFAWLILAPSDLKDFGQSLVAVSTFLSNFLFWLQSGYFDRVAELKPLLHTWSLAVEEQYYILFPVFLLLTWRMGIRWVSLLLVLVFFASLGAAHWGAVNHPSATFFLLHARVWELLIGVFAAFYLGRKMHLKSHWANQSLSLLGFGLIVYAIVVFDESTPFPSLYTLAPTIGTGLLIFSAVPKTFVHSVLSMRPIVAIGLVSYSAYLWHQPLFAFARIGFLGEVPDFLLIILCVTSIGMAWFSWRYVERPFRDKRVIGRRTVAVFSISGVVIFTLIGLSLHVADGFPERVDFSEELLGSFERPYFDQCFDKPLNHIGDDWGCNLGKKKGEVDYILFGDSHSISLVSIVDEIAQKKGVSVFFTGASGCLPFVGIYPNRADQNERNCNKLNERVFLFAKNNSVKGIVLAARWSFYTHGDYDFSGAQFVSESADGPFNLEHSIDSFISAFENTVDKYELIEVPIHLIAQHPHQKYDAESAYFSIAKGFGTISSLSVKRSDFERLNRVAIETFSDRKSDVVIHNTIDLFCDEIVCPIGEEDKSFYYDDDHLSEYGALRLNTILVNVLSSGGQADGE